MQKVPRSTCAFCLAVHVGKACYCVQHAHLFFVMLRVMVLGLELIQNYYMQITHRRRAKHQLQATQEALTDKLLSNGAGSTQDTSNVSSFNDAPDTPLPKVPRRKRRGKVEAESSAAEDTLATAADILSDDKAADQTGASAPVKKRKRQPKAKSVNAVEAVAAAVDAVAGDVGQPGKKKPKRQRVKATELAVDTETRLEDGTIAGAAVALAFKPCPLMLVLQLYSGVFQCTMTHVPTSCHCGELCLLGSILHALGLNSLAQ